MEDRVSVQMDSLIAMVSSHLDVNLISTPMNKTAGRAATTAERMPLVRMDCVDAMEDTGTATMTSTLTDVKSISIQMKTIVGFV